MSIFNWFKPKKESKAARMFKTVQGMDSEMAIDADPISITLKIQIPKFSKEMAMQKGLSVPEYLEGLLIDSLYVNRAVNHCRQDRMLKSLSYAGKGSKLVN